MKTKFLLVVGLLCFGGAIMFAQCPSGETELTFTINTPFAFAAENGWDVNPPPVSGVVEGGCIVGAVEPNATTITQTACFANTTVYTVNLYDTFGDNWNGNDGGGQVTVTITEDGSVNGQSALQGCDIAIVIPGDTGGGPDPTCSVAESFTFSVDGDATLISGCSDPAAINYNACVDPADDDGSCLIAPPPPPIVPIPGCTDTQFGAGHDGNYTSGNTASAVGGFSIAEDFSITTSGTVTEVAVQFFFQDALGNFFTTPPTENFEVVIYSDNAGAPGTPVLGPLTLTNADYVSTQVTGWLIFDVFFDIPDLAVTPGDFWLEVTFLSTVNNAFWILDENSLGFTGNAPMQTDNATGVTSSLFGNMVHSVCFAPSPTCTVNAGTDSTLDLCSADSSTDITPTDGDTGGSFSPALASGTGVFDPAVDVAGVYTYSVTDLADPTCIDTADITMNVTQAPVCNTDCTVGGLETFDLSTCSCVPDPTPVALGCTNPGAINYDPTANCDDGSCAALNGQCYVGSVTVGANGGDDGVCFETTYILVDTNGAVVASNNTGTFGAADGAAFNTLYDVYAFTYNMCALGFVAPTIPPMIAALDPTLNCGSLTAPFAVVLKDSNTIVCSADTNGEIRVGFEGWYTGNSQRYILSNANNGAGTILQINNTGVFPAASLAEGDYYVCAVNFPPADAAIVDGSVGQTLSTLEDICRSLSGAASYLTDCTLVSVVSEPSVSIALPTEWCTDAVGAVVTSFDPSTAGIGSFMLDYTYTDGNGCAGSASITLNVGDDCLAAGIPTASEWGLLCLALCLLSILAICIRQRSFELDLQEA